MVAVGRYELHEEVARGGMGAVWRAQTPDGATVALKFLFASLADEARRRRFQREVEALLRLAHPNVVRLLDAGQHEGRPYLVLEWVEGESLEERLRRSGPLDPRDAARLVARLARALAHCHAQGVLHRDLKPANVLLRGVDGEPLLTDFGLARDLSASLASGSIQGALLGTPGYWPPEQASGQPERIGTPADVWGLGALFHALLTGRPPCEGGDLLTALASLERAQVPPSALRPGLPPVLDRVCLRCLERDPADRYPDAAAVAVELERWLDRPRTAPQGFARVPARARAGGWLAALAMLGGGAITALLIAQAPEPREAPPAGLAPVASPALPEPLAATAPPGTTALPAAGGLTPSHQAAHERLARAEQLGARGDRVGALALLDQAIGLEQGCTDAYIERGRLRSAQNDGRGALADFDAAIRLSPDLPEAWAERGTLRDELGDRQGALTDFDQALRLDPGLAAAWINRGATHQNGGDLARARSDYDRAIALEPENAVAWLNRGVVRRTTGDPAGALQDLDRALALEPDRFEWHVDRAQALLDLERITEARQAIDRAIQLAPRRPELWVARATVRHAEGDAAGARADYDRAIALGPDHADAWAGRGALRVESDPAGAREDLDRALRLDPDNLEALLARGELRGRAGDRAGGLADLERIQRLAPAGDTTREEARELAERLRR